MTKLILSSFSKNIFVNCAFHHKTEKPRIDLYFRVNTVQIHLPKLSERPEDILLLTRHFIEKMNKLHDKSILAVTDDVKNKLQLYHWPGNIRELENVIEHAVVVSVGNRIALTDSFPEIALLISLRDLYVSKYNLGMRIVCKIRLENGQNNHRHSWSG